MESNTTEWSSGATLHHVVTDTSALVQSPYCWTSSVGKITSTHPHKQLNCGRNRENLGKQQGNKMSIKDNNVKLHSFSNIRSKLIKNVTHILSYISSPGEQKTVKLWRKTLKVVGVGWVSMEINVGIMSGHCLVLSMFPFEWSQNYWSFRFLVDSTSILLLFMLKLETDILPRFTDLV